MRHNTFNFIIFLLLLGGLGGLLWYANNNWLPRPEQKELTDEEKAAKEAAEKRMAEDRAKREEEERKRQEQAQPGLPPAPLAPVTLIPLGDADFYNQVLLSTRGGGVQQVVLPAFHQANRLGEEVRL